VPGARIHYGAGYTGNGVGPSWLGGQILASFVLGADDEWTRLPLVDPTPATGTSGESPFAFLRWGERSEPGRVKVHLIGGRDLAVSAAELPISVELTFDAAAAATRQCATTSFQSL
jgi:hypothetical protein